jgi:hypothetical protein
MIGGENITLSIVFIVLSFAFLIYTVYQVKRNKLLLRYSLMWILLSALLLVVAIFPQPIFALAKLVGFDIGSNFIFSAAIFFLLLLCLGQARTISQLVIKQTETTQRLALLEKRLENTDAEHQPE